MQNIFDLLFRLQEEKKISLGSQKTNFWAIFIPFNAIFPHFSTLYLLAISELPQASEIMCEGIKLIWSHANETNFHKKGFALSLVLKGDFVKTRKLPIALEFCKLSYSYCIEYVWNLQYESVHFKELHNDQEYYWPTTYLSLRIYL